FKRPAEKIVGDRFTILLVGGAVLFFSSLYSSYLVLRGKWRCMMNAPERRAAKWLMFASMVCICAGPALNFASGFVHADPAVGPQGEEVEAKPNLEKAAVRYTASLRERDMSGFLRMSSSVITPLGPIFFVLFLRAVHGCLGSFAGARVTELYLLFVVLLAA